MQFHEAHISASARFAKDDVNYNDTFLASTTWHADDLRKKKILYVGDGSRALCCSVVGIVSPDGLKMENHGDFDPDASSGDFCNAHFAMKLNIVEGEDTVRSFRTGFQQTVKRSKQLANVLPDQSITIKPFIDERDGIVTLSFTRRVFELKSEQDNLRVSPQQERLPGPWASFINSTRKIPVISYVVREDLRQFLPSLEEKYIAKNVSVCDVKETSIPTGHRNRLLENALVRVNFSLTFDPTDGLVAELTHIMAFGTDISRMGLAP